MNPFYNSIVEAAKNYNFQHVFRRLGQLECVAGEWAKEDFELPDWRTPVHWPFDNDDFIQFLGISTAINFCYDYPKSGEKFSVNWHGKNWSGAFGMFACIMRAIEKGANLLDARYLKTISYAQTKKIFTGNSEIPLLFERWDIWREIGEVLLEKYGGHFKNLFEEANYKCFDNGNGICERLVWDFPSAFSDTRELNGRTLSFHKKAFLLPLIYYGRVKSSDGLLPQIKDVEKLSAPADYELPKVLCGKNILYYSQELEKQINQFQEIQKYSLEEIEIRMWTVIAFGQLLAEINKKKKALNKEPISAPHLDFCLWNAGRTSKIPHHITLTTDY